MSSQLDVPAALPSLKTITFAAKPLEGALFGPLHKATERIPKDNGEGRT